MSDASSLCQFVKVRKDHLSTMSLLEALMLIHIQANNTNTRECL
jgi:hypothetical protein